MSILDRPLPSLHLRALARTCLGAMRPAPMQDPAAWHHYLDVQPGQTMVAGTQVLCHPSGRRDLGSASCPMW
jgi:hypothetical protein